MVFRFEERRVGGVARGDLEFGGLRRGAGNRIAGTMLIMAAAHNVLPDMGRALSEEKADPNYATHTGENAMHYAAGNGSVDAIRMLHEAGACLDSTNAVGETPLMLAVQRNRAAAVEELLRLKANTCIRTESGETARDMAMRLGLTGIAKMLDKEMRRN